MITADEEVECWLKRFEDLDRRYGKKYSDICHNKVDRKYAVKPVDNKRKKLCKYFHKKCLKLKALFQREENWEIPRSLYELDS